MKIIVFLSSLGTGGAEFSTLSFYGWLLERGHKIKLVCYKKTRPSYEPEQFGLQEVEYIEGNSFIKRLESFDKIAKQFLPDLIHSVLFEANIIARITRVRSRNFIHLESLVNETYSRFRLSDPNITRLKLEGYRLLDKVTQNFGVDHFHANGIAVSRHYQVKLGIKSNRITVIHRGRQPNQFVGNNVNRIKIREELRSGDRLIITNVGRHEFQKGQDLLLNAISLLGSLKDKIQVVLVGREGNLTNLITQKISENGLESCVKILGHRSDVSELLAASDIFIFSSRFEGLPGALIEAEAAGLPIICTDIANNEEVTERNKNAIFFDIGDSRMLAETIIKTVNDENLRIGMGRESLAIYEKKFSMEDAHVKLLSLLEKLTAKR